MNENDKQQIVKKIVIERIRSMSPNVKIALGSKGDFLSKDDLLREINANSDVGKKIIQIQLRYMQALKEGLV